MTHIDEGSLQAYLDGELHLEDRWRTERHLEECDACRAELQLLEGLSGTFSSAASRLERAPRSREFAVGWPARPRRSALRRLLPRVAVFLLFAGAAASATVPGSPVRSWIVEAIDDGPHTREIESAPAAAVPPTRSEPVPMEAGLSVEAVDGRVEVVLTGAHDLKVRTVMVDGMRAGVFGSGEAASSRFLGGAGRIEVLEAGAGDLRVEIPRGADLATMVINGNEVLRKQGVKLELEADAPALESARIGLSVEQ